MFDALKRLLKARGVHYAELSQRLGMSESGVKKMFSAEDCALSRLEEILSAVGFSLGDLFEAATRPAFEHVSLNDEQQRALLEKPLLLSVFWKLSVERWDEKRVAREFGIDKTRMRRLVSELDDLDLIRLEQPGDRIRLRHGDLVRWLPHGPLLDHIHRVWGRDVLERALRETPGYFRLHQLHLGVESRREFEAELSAFLDAWIRRGARESLTEKAGTTSPHGLLIALAAGSFVRPSRA